MLIKIEREKINELKKVIHEASPNKEIVIIVHVSPDGDAIGAALGLYHMLKVIGKKSRVIFPSAYPESFEFLSEIGSQIIAKRNIELARQLIRDAELIFCLDFNQAHRVADVKEDLLQCDAYKVHIDHHIYPEKFADLLFSYPQMSSTCLLVYSIFKYLKWTDLLPIHSIEALYTGMVTDTGGFSYNSDDPFIYQVISEMLEKGLEKDKITALITRSYTVDKIRLNAYVIDNNMTVLSDKKTAILTLTRPEKDKFNYRIGDTEGLVNVPLEAKEILLSIFIYEQKDFIKLSFRSKDPFACNKFAIEYFNGGGHRNAAGAEFYGTMDGAKEAILEALEKLHP